VVRTSGGSPSASSIAVMPKLQMSARLSYAVSRICSGLIQYGVPMMEARRDRVEVSCADTPKSASLQLPSSPSRTLPAFRSRWMMRRSS